MLTNSKYITAKCDKDKAGRNGALLKRENYYDGMGRVKKSLSKELILNWDLKEFTGKWKGSPHLLFQTKENAEQKP